MKKIKAFIKLILSYPNSTAQWVVRAVILILLVKVSFFNTPRTVTHFRGEGYRDSLEMERHKVLVLEELLIKNRIQDEKDSINLTTATLDSLIGYIANRRVASGGGKKGR